eukprot:Gregarina_sp_Pseudo_9__1850@NODE_2262_length_1073_cov_201_988395_g2081_i0_p1_GENE_NODE_2262_length_1073_cov_201_988395_g2081_i0NODE_2262_length_1073_cov_201_988395_g2081_i0_p1_ORF_typecomplete_len274_score64_68_NODE_2262_length_1073_cov_201_988395_g2081_i0132953
MLTRRKAALLKSGDVDSLSQQENEVPLSASPGAPPKSNKTPRVCSRSDLESERPPKRRRESPAVETLKGETETLKRAETPVLLTPRQRVTAMGEEFAENRLWVRFLNFSLCFSALYVLFWVLLLRVANVPSASRPSSLLAQDSDSISPDDPLGGFLPAEPQTSGPFLPFAVVNPSDPALLHSSTAKAILESQARVSPDEFAHAALLLIKHTDDCETAWGHRIGTQQPNGAKGCVAIDVSPLRGVWLDPHTPSVVCSRNSDSLEEGALECAFNV